jgi:hypothetical protein
MLPQKRHLIAWSWICSAQKGQGFTGLLYRLPPYRYSRSF